MQNLIDNYFKKLAELSLSKDILELNNEDKNFKEFKYLLKLESTYLVVYANNDQDAFDIAIDWIETNHPNYLEDEDGDYNYNEVVKECAQEVASSKLNPSKLLETIRARSSNYIFGGKNNHYIPADILNIESVNKVKSNNLN